MRGLPRIPFLKYILMMNRRLFVCLFFVLSVFLNVCATPVAGTPVIHMKQSNPSGLYRSGDRVIMKTYLEGIDTKSITVKVMKGFDMNYHTYQFKNSKDTITVFDEVINEPNTVVVEVHVDETKASLGAIVDADKFTPVAERPKDFKAFWKAQKKALKKLPMEVKETSVQSPDANYITKDIELNCLGGKPARGYLAVPQNAKKRSLPIVIFFHAAGVDGDWCRSTVSRAVQYAKMGSICFDLNAHGMLNGQPEQYYKDLANGELKNYPQIGVEDRNTTYFRGMYLRLLRTIDYVTSFPEWDGKRILVIGESQGGGQSLVAAGLDPRVKAVVATVPAMCDWGGHVIGRKDCWPYPYTFNKDPQIIKASMPYYDAANIIKGSKATFVVEIGLVDFTCVSSAIHAALNGVKGKKILLDVPYRAHHMEQPIYQKEWQENVVSKKDDFVRDYLK